MHELLLLNTENCDIMNWLDTPNIIKMIKLKQPQDTLFEDLINKSVMSWLVFSTLGISMVVIRSEITGWGFRENLQSLFWVGTLALVLFKNKLASKVKAGFLTGMLFVFAIVGVFSLGLFAAALHFLPLIGIFLLLFFPSKLAEKYYLLVIILMSVAGFLFINKWLVLPFKAEDLLSSWQHWLLVMLCFIFYIYFSTTALMVYKNNSDFLHSQLEAKNNRLKEASFIDAMTGLPLLERGGQLFEEQEAQWKVNGDQVAVMYLDLDEFKVINEVYGHETGDWCIKEVAYRLEKLIAGAGFVLRIGSDEFLVVHHGFDLKMHAVTWATKMLAEIQAPIALDHVKLKLNSSIGISFYPDDGSSLSALRRKADLAMYRAKVDDNLSISTYKSATT